MNAFVASYDLAAARSVGRNYSSGESSMHDEIAASQTDREVAQIREKHALKTSLDIQGQVLGALIRANCSLVCNALAWEAWADTLNRRNERQLAWMIGFAGALFITAQAWLLSVL